MDHLQHLSRPKVDPWPQWFTTPPQTHLCLKFWQSLTKCPSILAQSPVKNGFSNISPVQLPCPTTPSSTTDPSTLSFVGTSSMTSSDPYTLCTFYMQWSHFSYQGTQPIQAREMHQTTWDGLEDSDWGGVLRKPMLSLFQSEFLCFVGCTLNFGLWHLVLLVQKPPPLPHLIWLSGSGLVPLISLHSIVLLLV